EGDAGGGRGGAGVWRRGGASPGVAGRGPGVVVPGRLRRLDARVHAGGIGQALSGDGPNEGPARTTGGVSSRPAQRGQADPDHAGAVPRHDAGGRRPDGGRVLVAGHGAAAVFVGHTARLSRATRNLSVLLSPRSSPSHIP